MMTHPAEWLACRDPKQLIAWLVESMNQQRARLLALGLLWRKFELFSERERALWYELEHVALGNIPPRERISWVESYNKPILRQFYHAQLTVEWRDLRIRSLRMTNFVMDLVYAHARESVSRIVGPAPAVVEPGDEWHRRFQAAFLEAIRPATELIQCVFENPFREPIFEYRWRTDATVGIARQMFDSRDFSAMPILADALQDAGCEHEEVLAHARTPGLHCRGCWVVDAILGRVA